MITVTKQPTRWQAAHSPVIIGFQRKDFTVVSKSSVSGNPEQSALYLGNGVSIADLTGKVIYLNCGNYVGYYTVMDVQLSGYVYLFVNCPFKGVAINGYIVSDIARVNHYISLNIYKNTTLLTTLTASSFANGLLELDISDIISKNIEKFPLTEFSEGEIVKVSDNYSVFYLSYSENYSGFIGSVINISQFYGVNAVFQNGILNDGTLNAYAPYFDLEASPIVETKGKFLQGFFTPQFNINNPFEFQFIYQGGFLEEYPLTLNVKYLDINKNQIDSTYQYVFSGLAAGKLVRLNLTELTIPDTCYFLDVWIDAGDTKNTYVIEGYVDGGYVI